MTCRAACGETSYVGLDRLKGKSRPVYRCRQRYRPAVAIALAREGADVLLSYLKETDDAISTVAACKASGQQAVAIAGDIADSAHCKKLVDAAIDRFG
jgi:hypothetical protein